MNADWFIFLQKKSSAPHYGHVPTHIYSCHAAHSLRELCAALSRGPSKLWSPAVHLCSVRQMAYLIQDHFLLLKIHGTTTQHRVNDLTQNRPDLNQYVPIVIVKMTDFYLFISMLLWFDIRQLFRQNYFIFDNLFYFW